MRKVTVNNKEKTILKNGGIRGYHIFKITPLKVMIMTVEKEEEDKFNPYAMVNN